MLARRTIIRRCHCIHMLCCHGRRQCLPPSQMQPVSNVSRLNEKDSRPQLMSAFFLPKRETATAARRQ
jgi:hypothetical protein